ncbi:hypothetical protein [Thalassotalea sp. G2M2-11]|uniref:hypothetical protein n=1 Tax=Thalassotalea sp. G2M2-11 TaxID=2787627 RepID=UPI0019D05D5D|nr:hypothetical protein [Thalassotalea sp. G2M2-11]
MSKFDELNSLVLKDAELLFQNMEKAMRCAVNIVSHLSNYLEAPSNQVKLVQLSSDLSQRIKSEDKAKLVSKSNTEFHIGIEFSFSSSESNYFGGSVAHLTINTKGDSFIINILGENFTLSNLSYESSQAINKHVYESIKQDYEDSIKGEPRAKIGFL